MQYMTGPDGARRSALTLDEILTRDWWEVDLDATGGTYEPDPSAVAAYYADPETARANVDDCLYFEDTGHWLFDREAWEQQRLRRVRGLTLQ